MATKSSILSTINGFITSIVTVLKVRSAFSTLLDNIYPTVVIDIESTTNIFTKVNTDFIYDIKTSKVGRNVNICGSFTNDTESAISDVSIVNITTLEYVVATNVLNHRIPAISESGLIVFLGVTLSGTALELIGTAPKDVKFYFNGTYTVKD